MKHLTILLTALAFICMTSNAQTEIKEKTKKKIEGKYPDAQTSVQTENAHTAFATVHNSGSINNSSATASHKPYRRLNHAAVSKKVSHRHYSHYKNSRKHNTRHYKKIKRVHKKNKYKVKYKS